MKKKYVLFGMASMIAVAQLFTACSSEDLDSPSITPQKGKTISLTTTMATTRSSADPQTTQLSTSNQVGVFVTYQNQAIANGDNNMHSVAVNGDLTTTNTMNYPAEDGAKVNIYAYAPYAENMTFDGDNVFSVATDQSEESGYLASDLLYAAQANQASSESPVALSFNHKLAKINVTIQKLENATIDLSDATITVTNTKVATTFNPSTGAVGAATGDATDIKVISALGEATTACAIIVPQELAAGTQLVKIVADGKQLNAKLGAATTFVGGKSYNFTVKVGSVEEPVTEVELALGSAEVVGWDDQNLGEAEADGKLYAEFGTPGNNATYDAGSFTYTWTGNTSNLMNCFSFSNGELANYSKLNFAFTELSDGGSVRINVLFSDNTNKSKSYYTAGTKATPISELLDGNHTAADVTAIRFGGNSNSGSTVVKASEMYLE